MTASIIAAALTTPDTTRTLSVFASGLDVTGDVKWDTLILTDSGASARGTAAVTIERSPHLMPEITDRSLFRVEDHAAGGGEAFRGFILSRVPSQDPAHPSLALIAVDIGSLLDTAIVDVEYRPPESMQARIGYLWGKYAGQFLSGDLSYVLSVGGTLPAQRFELVSLRNAIEMTLAQASSSADYYLDMLGKLHVFTSETNNAPKNINADAPGGGEIAPENLRIEYDSGTYANRVLVKGATPVATLYVQDDAAIAAANGLVVTSVLQEPSVTTAAMATSLGLMYLGRVKAAKTRGSFDTSSAKADGWRGGQNVAVTSAAHALTAQSYKIARVTTRVLRPGANLQRAYNVEFGGSRPGAGLDGQQALVAGQTSGVFMLDQLGNSIVSAAASSSAGGLGPAVRRYIQSGVYNGDFYAPPPGPDAPISDTTNPLPYWSFVNVSGTAVTILSQPDTTAASGRSLVLSMAAGAAGDDVYIEQLLPINGSAGQSFTCVPSVTFVTNGTPNTLIEVYMVGQFVKADGVTTTGTSAERSDTITTINGFSPRDQRLDPEIAGIDTRGAVPSDAYFLRLRIGMRRGAAANGDTGSVRVTEARNRVGWVDWDITEATLPDTYGPTHLRQTSGAFTMQVNDVTGGSGSSPLLLLDGSGASGRIGFGSTSTLAFGFSSFPASPATNDLFYRTDLGSWFYYDGTRWLTATLFSTVLHSTAVLPLAATALGSFRAGSPLQTGFSDVWLEDSVTHFYVVGGTALAAGHKWVGLVQKSHGAPVQTTIDTVNIDSGASSTWRSQTTAVDALLNGGTVEDGFEVGWTKTGTPGNLHALHRISYRLVAT